MSQGDTEIERFKKAFKGTKTIADGKEGANLLLAASNGGKKIAVLRKAAVSFDQQDGETLKELANKEEGRELLKRIVKDLGDAKTDEAKTFVQNAIKAQYNIDTLEGHLTTKALPRLFKTLAKVPEWHVRDNDKAVKIKRFKREDASDVDSKKRSLSWYKPEDTANNKPSEIVLNLGRTSDTESYYPGGKKTKVNSFDVTTLHEVAHAVDDDLGYMKAKMAKDDYGKWKELSERALVKEVLVDKFGFFVKYKKYPKACLDALISDVINNGVIKKPDNWDLFAGALEGQKPDIWKADPGIVYAEGKRKEYAKSTWPAETVVINDKNEALKKVKINAMLRFIYEALLDNILLDQVRLADALDAVFGEPDTGPDWTAMADEPALKFLLKARLQAEDTGLWDGGDAAATEAAVDNKWVYQQSYASKWYRYSLDARADRVSDYQFRAPGEWFAELYALYFVGKLPKAHKACTWLKSDIDVDDRPDPSTF